MSKETVGLKLRSLREAKGYNAKDVSAILEERFSLNVQYKTIYNYENGRNSPDVDVFLALCKIYGCRDVLYEFGYTDIKEIYNIHNSEEKEVVEKYRKLPESGKDLIRGALGIEKGEEQRKEEIS